VESNIDSLTPDSICVIRLSALGDCCHALPVVRTLQDNFPDTKLTWIVGKTEFQLLEGIEDIEFIIFDKSNLLQSLIKLSGELKHRKFDILLHMHASMTANLVSCLVKATRKIGFDKDRARDLQRLFCNETIAAKPRQHVMDGLFGFAEHLGVGSKKLQWDLTIPESASIFANNHIQKGKINCVISPCSSQRFGETYDRSWSVENYLSVIEHLIKTYDIQIILTGGATAIELSYGKKISQHFKNQVKNLINQTSLKELAALVDKADFVLCPDSGPAHIATAMNTSVIGLYAMSNPLRSGPYCSQDCSINAYPKAAQKFLNKEISELKWGYRIKEPEAMNLITPMEVIKKIDQLILHKMGQH